MVLLAVSVCFSGGFFGYDALPPIANLLSRQLHFSDSNIGLIQAAYSFPTILTLVIGGILTDRIGIRRSLMLFTLILFLGAVITALSPNLWVMASGRLLSGMGTESMYVTLMAAVARWFKGKDLSFAFGAMFGVGRVAGFISLNMPSWAHAAFTYWRYPLLITAAVSALSVLGALAYWVLEVKAESSYNLGAAGQSERVVLKDLFHFGASYWYIVGLCVVFYSAVFPFQTFAVKFFMDAHGTSLELSSFLNSLLTLFAILATPLFGLLVDRVGRRSLFMMYGSMLLIPVYLLMGYTHINLFVPMGMMGIAVALIPAVMWPSVGYVVDQGKLGTAYGLMTMVQNSGLFAINLLIGWANDHSRASALNPHGYVLGMKIFSTLGLVSMLLALLLRRREVGQGNCGLETITTAAHA
jgi:MFS family permease